MNDIPNFETFRKIEFIAKGKSNDKKFYIETFDDKRMLLRLTDIKEFDRKKAESLFFRPLRQRQYSLFPFGMARRRGCRNSYAEYGRSGAIQCRVESWGGVTEKYFNNKPPRDFFELLSYYFACDALSALCYTFLGLERCKPEDGRRHMENILRWFDDMNNTIPTWYKAAIT